jgi:hypothetical protein
VLSVALQAAAAPSLTDTVPEGLAEIVPDGVTVTFACTCCPTTAAVGINVSASNVFPLLTTSDVEPVLLLKNVLPLYVAATVSELLNAKGVILQLPEPLTRLTVQLAPVLSLTETDPVGTPVPANDGDTVTETDTDVPSSAGFGDAVTASVVFSVKLTLMTSDAL